MGVATSMAIIGGVASAAQAIKGAQQAKEAEEALNNLPIPQLVNPYENLSVSRLGADLQTQEAQRTAASNIEALQGAGVRGLVGGVGRVQSLEQQQMQQVAADLDAQQKQIDMARAQGASQIQGMEEQRFKENRAALSSQYSQGNQQMWAGFGGIAQSAMAGISGNALQKGATNPTGTINQGLNPNLASTSVPQNIGYNFNTQPSQSIFNTNPIINPQTGRPFGQ
jgi:hypothetical protein